MCQVRLRAVEDNQYKDDDDRIWIRDGHKMTCHGPCPSSTKPMILDEQALTEALRGPSLVESATPSSLVEMCGNQYHDSKTNEIWYKVWDHKSGRHVLIQCKSNTLKMAPWYGDLSLDEHLETSDDTKGLFVPGGSRSVSFPMHIYTPPTDEYLREMLVDSEQNWRMKHPVTAKLLDLADMTINSMLPSERKAHELELIIPARSRFPGYIPRLLNESSLRYSDRVEDAYYVWLKARLTLFERGDITILDDREESPESQSEEAALYDAAMISVQMQVL